jgi:hypothetical protein
MLRSGRAGDAVRDEIANDESDDKERKVGP